MNKKWKIAGAIAVLAAVFTFAWATPTFAQSLSQTDDLTPPGPNQAQNGPHGGMGYMAVDPETLHAAIAEALGMSITDFEAALAERKTPAILAQEKGIDFAVVLAAMDAVHADALQQAVANGLITQEQANWILSRRGGQNGRGNGFMGNGMNQGNGYGQANGGFGQGNGLGGGMQGQGGGNFGNNGNAGTCPYQTS